MLMLAIRKNIECMGKQKGNQASDKILTLQEKYIAGEVKRWSAFVDEKGLKK